jgi:hypothetical protein
MSLLYRACAHFGLSTPRQLRLWWLRIFRQTYVVQMRLKKKGECSHQNCATICCNGCPWLIKKGNLFFCKDYENAPINCREFPIDKVELERMNKILITKNLPKCNYYWEQAKNKKVEKEGEKT